MATEDRMCWDRRYRDRASRPVHRYGLPAVFRPFAEIFPTTGYALDVACGQGLAGIWLARRGMHVHGIDISAVAIAQANALSDKNGLGMRCRFTVADLDDGLPAGPPVDVLLCSNFRDARLDEAMAMRLAPRGLLAISGLSRVKSEPARYRVHEGELVAAFHALELIAAGESHGRTWLLARSGL